MQFLLNNFNKLLSFRLSNPILSAFIIISFIFSLYVVWREGRKDGFLEEKIFDNYILTFIIALLTSRVFYAIEARFLFGPFFQHVLYFWRDGFSLEGFIIGFIAGGFLLSFFYKWSLFRLFDIYSLALSMGGSIFLIGFAVSLNNNNFYVPSLILFTFYIIFSFLRLGKVISGLTFVIFLNIFVLVKEYIEKFNPEGLIFNSTLVTIGLLTLIFRLRRSMFLKRSLPADVLLKLKDSLLRKSNRLSGQQKLLEEEDPYLQSGRSEGNSDDIDEAHLEDNLKNIVDAQKSLVKKSQGNVKEALGKMKKGEYGICERCGAPIDPARLKAYPEATLCADCARKEE